MITLNDKLSGCLLGLACGDAVGTTVEFKERGAFEPLIDMGRIAKSYLIESLVEGLIHARKI
ncbi:hypothetical protein QEH59_15660 [Coraliomargarita sp. SDUM461004]|uniref:ADP-ribosylglycohydrolase n=1 Tax=Thalassobacterium sedimentorum TaxID=3041258 RepID=A0ABU1AM37_9BACT|nr:ADP-ribosylglycohydrolase family protein [Coraliomargarita sp. SDUM461004]MDQ8195870.1 hypothetical protein [Coraliomargarita sp. SDUM461004]